ncbi:MAG TPA: GAF domain-containing protein [Candidatus Obscuribacterales bacterium]
MSAPHEEKLLSPGDVPADAWQLLHKLGALVCRVESVDGEGDPMLQAAVDALGTSLGLDRCLVLLWGSEYNFLEVTAEFICGAAKSLGFQKYQLGKRSEFYQLLSEGKPLPLKDLRLADSTGGALELERFLADSESRSVVAFPLLSNSGPIGFLSMHYVDERKVFSEGLLELGEMLSQELSIGLELRRNLKEQSTEGRFFRFVDIPVIIFDKQNTCVVNANSSAKQLFANDLRDITGIALAELLPNGQSSIEAAIRQAESGSAAVVPGLLVNTAGKAPQSMDIVIARLLEDSGNQMAVFMHLSSSDRMPALAEAVAGEIVGSHSGDMVASLSRQLAWERWTRQIICRIHSSLDRDSLLQSVADSLGHALGLSRCMIVRTDGLVAPMVTHEYAEPDISPLGLGRTGQFPARIVNHFKARARAIQDVSDEKGANPLSEEEIEWLTENGFCSLIGGPIAYRGTSYGVIIGVASGRPRQWLTQEIDMLEIACAETAVALTHSQAFLQVKDQLFNMNLLGNLTQQLTNTLELATKSSRVEEREERIRSETGSPPLSLRELEVLKLIASGLANREIAQRLYLTESTVELHASRIRKKLKLKSRTALVKYACDNNLV